MYFLIKYTQTYHINATHYVRIWITKRILKNENEIHSSFPYHSYSLSEDIDFRMYPLNYIDIIQWPMTYGREGKWDFNCLSEY